jgi:PilZ domain
MKSAFHPFLPVCSRSNADISLRATGGGHSSNSIQFGQVNGKLFIFFVKTGAMNNLTPAVATPEDGRRQSRTHLFVAATLYSGVESVGVHIRNMSPSGALIESSTIPEPGAGVILKRGSLHCAGKVVWKVERKGGIAFETTARVADWISRHPSEQQQRVDEIVSNFRSNGRSDTCTPVDPQTASRARSIEAELMTLRFDLAKLEAGLISDAILVATHPEIQVLDVSLQRIDRLITHIQSAGNKPSP